MSGIVLSQVAPWNKRLTNPYRRRYAHVDGRYFMVEADNLAPLWFVREIDAEAERWQEWKLIAIVFNYEHARVAIQMWVDGASDQEISHTLANTPKRGVGRNSPANVERRERANRPGRLGTAGQAAEVLGIDMAAVWELVAAGELVKDRAKDSDPWTIYINYGPRS